MQKFQSTATDKVVLTLKADGVRKGIAFILFALFTALSIYYVYGIIYDAGGLSYRIFLFAALVFFFFGPLIVLLNVNFRLIQFGNDGITVKRWYAKDRFYLYKDVVSAESEIAVNKITIFIANGGKIRIPEYLLRASADLDLWGEDVLRLLKEKCGDQIKISHI